MMYADHIPKIGDSIIYVKECHSDDGRHFYKGRFILQQTYIIENTKMEIGNPPYLVKLYVRDNLNQVHGFFNYSALGMCFESVKEIRKRKLEKLENAKQ